MNTRSMTNLLSLLFAFTVVVAACGDSGDAGSDSGSGDGSSSSGDLEGNIFISGSSTVEPISIKVAESFEDVESGVIVDVEGPGTGDGFLKFCAGESDISDASRTIKDEEAAQCEENGIEYVELRVGIDGISVVTSTENTAIEGLNFADLYALVGPESEGFETWADGNSIAAELGSASTLPDADLLITAPGSESGTYDSFIEIVLEDFADERGQDATTRTDYSSAGDDNTIVTNIGANPTSFGWVGFAFADLNRDSLRLIPIAEGTGTDYVDPTPETIASGEYPISRALYIYVSKNRLDESPALAAFVDHYMSVGLDESVAAADYVTLDDAAKAETRAAWDGR